MTCRFRGVTLVELIVYLALFGLLSTLVYDLVLGGLRLGRTDSLEVRQQLLRFTGRMAEDVRHSDAAGIYLETQRLVVVPIDNVSNDGRSSWSAQLYSYTLNATSLERRVYETLPDEPYHLGSTRTPVLNLNTVGQLASHPYKVTEALAEVKEWQVEMRQTSGARPCPHTRLVVNLPGRAGARVELARTLR